MKKKKVKPKSPSTRRQEKVPIRQKEGNILGEDKDSRNDELRTYFYYVRGPDNRPTTTICLLCDEKNGNYSRGVATASVRDRVQRKVGRSIAEVRAKRAMKKKDNALEIRRWDILPFEASRFFRRYKIRFKSEIDPMLSPLERRIMAPLLV